MAQQLKKKFIGNDQVDSTKIKLLAGQALRGVDSNGLEQELIKLDGADKVILKGEEAALKSQVDAEQAAREAADLALDGRLDVIEGPNTQSGSIAKAQKDAQDYADQKIADLVDSAPAVLDTLKELALAIGNDANFSTTIVNQVAGVQSNLTQEIADRIADVNAEESRAIAAETVLQGNIDTLTSEKVAKSGDSMSGSLFVIDPAEAQDYTEIQFANVLTTSTDGSGGTYTSEYGSSGPVTTYDAGGVISTTEINPSFISLTVDSGSGPVAALPTAPEHVVTKQHLDNELAALSAGGIAGIQTELDATQIGAGLGVDGAYLAPVGSNYLGLATSLKDADSKLDAQIKVVADGLAQEIIDRVADVDAEESRASAAEAALDSRIDVLEAVQWYKEKFTVNATIISNGFVTLSHSPLANSSTIFVDRLGIHEGAGEDYTISGAVVTFHNELVSPGGQALQNGDEIFVKYQA